MELTEDIIERVTEAAKKADEMAPAPWSVKREDLGDRYEAIYDILKASNGRVVILLNHAAIARPIEHFFTTCTPAVVLAMIERIAMLEGKLADVPSDRC